MFTCPQCGHEIDTTQEYDAGGRPGLLDQITRPSHAGACETMPVFYLAYRVPVVAVPSEYRSAEYLKRREAAQRGWLTRRREKVYAAAA